MLDISTTLDNISSLAECIEKNATYPVPDSIYEQCLKALETLDHLDLEKNHHYLHVREILEFARADKMRHMLAKQERERKDNNRKSFNYARTFIALGRRDGFCCRTCASHEGNLEIDHIVPVSKGGTNDLDNLQLLCGYHNAAKGAR